MATITAKLLKPTRFLLAPGCEITLDPVGGVKFGFKSAVVTVVEDPTFICKPNCCDKICLYQDVYSPVADAQYFMGHGMSESSAIAAACLRLILLATRQYTIAQEAVISVDALVSETEVKAGTVATISSAIAFLTGARPWLERYLAERTPNLFARKESSLDEIMPWICSAYGYPGFPVTDLTTWLETHMFAPFEKKLLLVMYSRYILYAETKYLPDLFAGTITKVEPDLLQRLFVIWRCLSMFAKKAKATVLTNDMKHIATRLYFAYEALLSIAFDREQKFGSVEMIVKVSKLKMTDQIISILMGLMNLADVKALTRVVQLLEKRGKIKWIPDINAAKPIWKELKVAKLDSTMRKAYEFLSEISVLVIEHV